LKTMSRKVILLVLPLILLILPAAASAESKYSVLSPDRRIEITVETGDRIRYSVLLGGKALLKDSTLSLKIDQKSLGPGAVVARAKQRSVDQEIKPTVRQKFATIRERYNELRLEMDGWYAVVFRAYNEGAAYRFETSIGDREVKVQGEEAGFNFAGDWDVYYPKEDSLFSHNERRFIRIPLKSVTSGMIASLPAVVDAGGGIKIAVCESDVEAYPGMWLRGDGSNALWATFPPYPLKQELTRDRDYRVTQSADYIAVTSGTRTLPWRLFGIVERDGDLLTNQLVYLLAKPSQVADTSWIKPGKVAWDWWNANNIYGVDFKAGINTETYKYYIDFAAKYGIEYVILDEGWYKLGNLLQVVPGMNIEELVAYGKQKNVGIILWCVWKTLDDQFEAALNQFQKWGVKGIKVDFMQRDDELVIDFYHRLCRQAADRKLLVDFHGGIRPSIMTRTWPNLISTEGVQGMEHLKWSDASDPEHNVTIPFTRMFMGPMDYTPGAMLNATKGSFAHIFQRPMSMGTRCHQLAMYVVYESPLQMLADSPSNYLREPETMEFLGPVPTVWDETKVIDGRIGEYVAVARRSGRDWYVGAMTNWTARELELDCSFLPGGSFRIDAYQDGVNADRYAGDYKRVTSPISRESKLKIKVASGGGWAARITPTGSD